ncbi:hypothetical protein HKX48_006763, partial [Thoreauomyces humboldtii]
ETNSVIYGAIASHDCLALAALLRENTNNDTVWDAPRGPSTSTAVADHTWRYAVGLGSATILDCLAQFDDPTPQLEKNRTLLAEHGFSYENGRFVGGVRLNEGYWTAKPIGSRLPVQWQTGPTGLKLSNSVS